MSDERWEIVQVDNHYMLDEETGMFRVKNSSVRNLLRRKRKDESV